MDYDNCTWFINSVFQGMKSGDSPKHHERFWDWHNHISTGSGLKVCEVDSQILILFSSLISAQPTLVTEHTVYLVKFIRDTECVCESVVVFSVSTLSLFPEKVPGEETPHTHPSPFSHPAIFQLHAHQAWHWWNVPAQLPHKNPHLQSLAPISPLAKLPSRAVDLQMCFLQSPAQHETPQTEETTHSCISKGPRGKITARTKRWLGRQKGKMTKEKRKETLMEFSLSGTL